MQFITDEEAREWYQRYAAVDEDRKPIVGTTGASIRIEFSKRVDTNYYWLAKQLVTVVQPFERCLLWVSLTGVWPSRENLHLYYTLRHAHGDRRLIEDAPGHLALNYEIADLVSFTFLGLVSGWDMYLCASEDYGRAFVSHDGWMSVSTSNKPAFEELSRQFESNE